MGLGVALLPFIQTAGEKYRPKHLHDMLGEFFKDQQVPVVDLLPTIAGRDRDELMVNRRDAHPNEQAHQLFAEAIWLGFYADSGS